MDPTILPRQLKRVFVRLAAVGMFAGSGWAVVTAAIVVGIAVWLDLFLELPTRGRVAALLVSGTVSLLVVGRAIWLVRKRSPEDRLAQELDRAGNTGGRIRVGVDLLRNGVAGNALTAGFAAIAVAEAVLLARTVQASRVAPVRPMLWPVVGAAALAASCFIVHLMYPGLVATQWQRFVDPFGDHPPYSRVKFSVEPGDTRVVYGGTLEITARPEGPPQDRLNLTLESADGTSETVPMFAQSTGEWRTTLTNVTTPFRYHVRSSAGRSSRFQVDVITVPNLERVRFQITPPAYTGRPAYEGPLPPTGIAGLPGTQVKLWASSNRPLSGGRLTITPPVAEPIQVVPVTTGDSEVVASFEIRAAGHLRLKVHDVDGQESSDTFTAQITLLTDEAPFVRTTDTKELSLATPTANVPVGIAAEDDYGLARIRLYRSLNNSRPQPLDIPISSRPALRTYDVVYLPLADFGLKPGDELKLFARAGDTDPAGSKVSETPVAVIRIVSQAHFEKMLQARHGLEVLLSKYRQAQRRLESANAELDQLRKKRKDRNEKGAAKDRDRSELRELIERLRNDALAARNAAAKSLDIDLDKALNSQLTTLSRNLDALAKALEELSRNEGLTQEEIDKMLQDASERLAREMAEYQKEVLDPLDFLKTVLPLLEDAKRFEKLVARQKDLAKRLEAVKDQDRIVEPAKRNQSKVMQAEQEQIRGDLARLLETIEERIELLPDNPALSELKESAREFVDGVRQSGATEAMIDAETGLSELSGKRGHAAAKKAAEILEQFLSKMQGEQGMSGRGRRALRFQPGLGMRLGNSLEQMLGQSDGEGGEGEQGESGSGASSSRRDRDVGLYGNLPGLGDMSSSELTNRQGVRGATNPNDPVSAKSGPGQSGDGRSTAPTVGSNRETVVPAAYRRRVAEYFQRVADETGK